MPFTDPDTQDYYDAWCASLRSDATIPQAYEAGWNAAMRAVREWRQHEDKIRDEERREDARWNR
jgi:hypothetical protein